MPRLLFNVFPILLEQDIRVISSGAVRRRDIVLFDFQPVNDLFGGFVICGPAFGAKLGQYLVQALDAGLRIIRKGQYAPTNCRRLRNSPVPSAMLFML